MDTIVHYGDPATNGYGACAEESRDKAESSIE